MNHVLSAMVACAVLATGAAAQDAPRDRKDHLAEALTIQRNEAADVAAACYADAKTQIVALTKENQSLKAELEKLRQEKPQ